MIKKSRGKVDLTNWRNIDFYHKNLAAPDAKILQKSINKYHKEGFTIKTTGSDYQSFIDNNLKKLTQHQHAWRACLRKAKIPTLFDLLYRCNTIITDPKTLSRTTYRIKSFIKKKCGLQAIPNFTISYPYDHNVNTSALKQTIYTMIDQTDLTDNIKKHIKLQLRIVQTSRDTIARIITNTKKACKSFDPHNPPKCIAHNL